MYSPTLSFRCALASNAVCNCAPMTLTSQMFCHNLISTCMSRLPYWRILLVGCIKPKCLESRRLLYNVRDSSQVARGRWGMHCVLFADGAHGPSAPWVFNWVVASCASTSECQFLEEAGVCCCHNQRIRISKIFEHVPNHSMLVPKSSGKIVSREASSGGEFRVACCLLVPSHWAPKHAARPCISNFHHLH